MKFADPYKYVIIWIDIDMRRSMHVLCIQLKRQSYGCSTHYLWHLFYFFFFSTVWFQVFRYMMLVGTIIQFLSLITMIALTTFKSEQYVKPWTIFSAGFLLAGERLLTFTFKKFLWMVKFYGSTSLNSLPLYVIVVGTR